MGALARVKESKIGQVIGGAFGAFIVMLNSEYEEASTVETVVNNIIKENPEQAGELSKIVKIAEVEEKVLEEMASKIGVNENNDNDKNKLFANTSNIEVENLNQVENVSKERAKGGKERTRAD